MPTVLVTGANRGLGLEFARQYAADGWQVIGTVRGAAPELEQIGGVRVETVDMVDPEAVAAFGGKLGGEPLDLLIANAGVMGPRQLQSGDDVAAWIDTLTVNTIAPTLLAQALLGNVQKTGGKIVAITSQMGSIADNSSGGYIAYRSSKAALNMAWKSLSVDHSGVTIAVLNPGWVQTDMGGAGATITPKQSISGMRRVIERLGPDATGRFFDHGGEELEW